MKFLVWFKDGSTKHFDDKKEMLNSIKDFSNVETITTEMYWNNKYIGEVDYTIKDFFENFS